MRNICAVRPITAKDIMDITGRSERQSRRILRELRRKLGKRRGQVVTVTEFCQYKGYDEKKVAEFLKLKQE